jgi:hypothetical protein
MMYPRFLSNIGKVCALVGATLVLPALAFAGHDNNGKGNDRDHERNEKGNDRDRDDRIPVVPETNTGWVLIPFVGAVLLFSWRQFHRAKV